jgi:hypothetical protein
MDIHFGGKLRLIARGAKRAGHGLTSIRDNDADSSRLLCQFKTRHIQGKAP